MSFKAEDRSIYDLLNDKMYSIPNNQRKYVWNRQNWDELFNDVKLIVESKTSNHFLGSIGDYLFVFFSLDNNPRNAVYANEKEPRVRPRFQVVEMRGVEPLTS